MYQSRNSPWPSSSCRFLPDPFMTLSFHFILVTWEILVHSSMSLTELSARSKCHPGTSPVASLGCFCILMGWVILAHISSSGPAFLQGVCFCWPPIKPCFPLPRRCLLLSSLLCATVKARAAFGSPYVCFESCRFSLTPRLLELDLFSFLLLLGALQEWKKTIAILDPRFSLRTSLTDLFVFILLVPESETGAFQQSQKKNFKMFLFVNCPF